MLMNGIFLQLSVLYVHASAAMFVCWRVQNCQNIVFGMYCTVHYYQGDRCLKNIQPCSTKGKASGIMEKH